MEAVIDQIIFWVNAGCRREPNRFCRKHSWSASAKSSTCIHAQTSFNCLQVSKEFLTVGARYLWSNYATFPDLLRLVGVHSGEYSASGCCQSLSVHQVDRWKYYSKYITEVILDDKIPVELLTLLPVIGAVAGELEGEPLIPRLESLIIGAKHANTMSANVVAMHLLSTRTTQFSITFAHPPAPDTVRGFFRAARKHAGVVAKLTVHCGSDSHDHSANVMEEDMLISSHALLRSMDALEHLSLDPQSITVETLDVIGTLPNLKYLTACYDDISSYVVLDEEQLQTVQRRNCHFLRLEVLKVQAELYTFTLLVGAFLPRIGIRLSDLFVSTGEKFPEEGDFSFLDTVGPELKSLEFEFFFSVTPLSSGCFQLLPRCPKLENLVVRQKADVKFGQLALSHFLSSCASTNLQSLTFVQYNSPSGWRIVPQDANLSQLRTCHQAGLDVSCLEEIACHLPRLIRLELRIVACDTAQLSADTFLARFRNLEVLQLCCSFTNWLLPGFNRHQAARYISALLLPTTRFSIKGLPQAHFSEGGPEWEDYLNEYNNFAANFQEQVENYVMIRVGELSRLSSVPAASSG